MRSPSTMSIWGSILPPFWFFVVEFEELELLIVKVEERKSEREKERVVDGN